MKFKEVIEKKTEGLSEGNAIDILIFDGKTDRPKNCFATTRI